MVKGLLVLTLLLAVFSAFIYYKSFCCNKMLNLAPFKANRYYGKETLKSKLKLRIIFV